MKFKTQRQLISKDLQCLCVNIIKRDKIKIPQASKQIVKGLPSILREIRTNGLPSHLCLKKLKGKLGYGIFLHPKAPPILKGEPIAPYSGTVVVCPKKMESDSDYIFSLIADIRLTKEEQKKWDPSSRYHPNRLYAVDVDAEKKGNFTRFINHSTKPNIEAQFVRIPPNSEGLPSAPFELVYVAKKTIHPGEQLLVCYEEGEDKTYWGALKIKPFPMTPKTFMLNHSCQIVEHAPKN